MWPRKKKQPTPDQIEFNRKKARAVCARKATQKHMRDMYPLYSVFSYLGVTCRVVQHVQRYERAPKEEELVMRPPIGLTCRYVNGQGQFREKSFDFDDLLALAANPAPASPVAHPPQATTGHRPLS